MGDVPFPRIGVPKKRGRRPGSRNKPSGPVPSAEQLDQGRSTRQRCTKEGHFAVMHNGGDPSPARTHERSRDDDTDFRSSEEGSGDEEQVCRSLFGSCVCLILLCNAL